MSRIGSQRLRAALLARGVARLLLAVFVSGALLSAQDGTQPYVIRLRDDAVIEHMRRQPVAATRRMNLRNSEAVGYRALLAARQGMIRQRIESLTGAEVRERMDTVFNGLAVRLRPQDIASVAAFPEVAEIIPSILYHKVLDAAAPLVQLPAAWSTARIGGEFSAGAGIKIGVIDTGIDINHPMFQDGSLTPPPGFPVFTTPTASCPKSDQLFTNSKVIVARNYVSLLSILDLNCDAMDRDGHGTFVAGVAAGRRAQGPLANISGVAPKAFLASYKVFGTPGVNDNASLEAILKALDDATKDGMDIINLSLGAVASLPPAQDPLAQAVAAAVNAGITVVVAAGNEGPATGTIDSPGIAPEAITVGATTNSRVLANPLFVSGPEPLPPDLQLIAAIVSNGPAITFTIGPARLTEISTVDASASACSSLPSTALITQIALIPRGGCTFATKITNAWLAGAIAVVIYNNQFQQPAIAMDVGIANQIPSVMIGNREGTSLAGYLAAAGPSATGTLGAQQQAIPAAPNQVTSFSSVGPSTDFGIKPDLVAPGANIYSSEQRNFPGGAQFSSTGFGSTSGTSFSAPMVAGAAALVKQASPGFTPAQIKSVLVQTAAKVAVPISQDVTGVLATGNGLMDVAAALASPATAAPVSLNLGTNSPGSTLNKSQDIRIQNVTASTDTFTISQVASSGSALANLTPTPASFTLAPGAISVVAIQATSPQPITGTVEGVLTLQSQNTGRTLTIPYWGNFLRPSIDSNRAVNTASLFSGPVAVAAGSYITMFGSQLTAGAAASAMSVPLPTSLAGITVLVDGTKAPLHFVSPTQINLQVPQEVAGRSLTTLQIQLNGVASDAVLLSLATTGPGIFALNQAGTGRGAVLHSISHGVVGPGDPARRGEILEVYGNGFGPTVPFIATGQPTPFSPLSVATFMPSASLGGVPAPVLFAGLAPTFVGLYQVNIEVPADAPMGEVPLILTSNGVASNPVTISIGP